MEFVVLPVIDVLLELYAQPRGRPRFQHYLSLLEGGSKGDLVLPLQFFNPMAKAHVAGQLSALRQLDAEGEMRKAIGANEHRWKDRPGGTFRIALNLADDVHGGWTDRFTTDYDSRFRMGALVKRRLGTALFWASEVQDAAMIRERTVAVCLRSLYWLKNGPPQTLAQHFGQEQFALSAGPKPPAPEDSAGLKAFYEMHRESRDPQLIFSFLYGDAAVESMGNRPAGIAEPFAGLKLAAQGTGS